MFLQFLHSLPLDFSETLLPLIVPLKRKEINLEIASLIAVLSLTNLPFTLLLGVAPHELITFTHQEVILTAAISHHQVLQVLDHLLFLLTLV